LYPAWLTGFLFGHVNLSLIIVDEKSDVKPDSVLRTVGILTWPEGRTYDFAVPKPLANQEYTVEK
jgi:hypothetical protein